MSRLEVRDDWSNQAFFEKGHGHSRNQATALVGMIAFFGPKK